MKVTVDLDTLVAEGKLSFDDAEKLRKHAGRETVSTALSALVIFGVIAVVAATLVLLHNTTITLVLGAALFGIGYTSRALEDSGWGALRQTLMVVGVLLAAGAELTLMHFSAAAWSIAAVGLLAVALGTGSGFVGVLAALAVGPLLNAAFGYFHATYFIMVERPLETVALYGVLAWLAFTVSKRAADTQSGPLITYSRTCLFLAQFGFWVGSLWGDPISFGRSASQPQFIEPTAFAIGWAVAMLAVGAWAAREGRRWVVNLCVVFGMINFYTQWFEHLHASATSVLIAGLITLAVGLALRKYNQK
jgi:iron complex transport system permease protein